MAKSRWAGVGSLGSSVGVVSSAAFSGWVAVLLLPNKEVGRAMRTTPNRASREASCSLRVKGSLSQRWQM